MHHDLYAADPLLKRPYLDDAYYVEMASRMARGEAFDWFLAPLHPWLGARLAGGSGPSIAFLGGLNAVLGALTSGVVALAAARIARALQREVAAAWTAGLLHAAAGIFVFHDVLPGQEAALGLFTALAILCGAHLASVGATGDAVIDRERDVDTAPEPYRRAALWAAGLGLAVGLAALGRGTSLVLVACAIPGLLRLWRARGSTFWLVAGACVGGLVVALAPASIHNMSVAGTPSPFPASGGANAYLSNGPDARSAVAMTSTELGNDPWSIEERSRRIAGHHMGTDVTTRLASGWWWSRTLDEAGGVGALTAHLARKAALFFTAEERGSNHAAHAERGYATYLRLVSVAGWWLLALGIGSWWLVRRRAPIVDVAVFAIAATWLALTVFFPVDRYRLPALVSAAALVGVAAVVVPGMARAADRRRLAQAGLIVAVVAGLAFAPIGRPDPAAGHVNVAFGLRDQGAPTAEIDARLRLALAADPEHGPANEMLGRLRLAEGAPQEAFDLLARAAADGRTRLSAQIAALPAMLQLGRGPEAWRAAQGLLGERADDPELLANAALCAAAVGDRRAAADMMVRAEAIAPGHPAVVAARTRLR